MKKLVLYHGQCLDGFAAAWVAFRALGASADYHAVQYGDSHRHDVAGREVFLLDFAYPRGEVVEMKQKATSLVVLDHHVTAQQDLAGLDYAHFDLERSGATITWDWFFPDEPRPWLIQYVEDKDLWRWKLKDSEAVTAALQSYSRSFRTWEKLQRGGVEALAAEGRPIVRYKNRLVETAASRTRMIEFDGYRIPVVTSCVLQSEIGSRLAKDHPFVAIVFESDARRVWSLRSHESSGINVAEIARRHGGGGHPNAAGFVERMAPAAPDAAAPDAPDSTVQRPEGSGAVS